MLKLVHLGSIGSTARPPLTAKQKQIYDWMRSYLNSNGFMPSYRDIADAFGICSTNGVTCHVKALVKKGYARTAERKARAIVLL